MLVWGIIGPQELNPVHDRHTKVEEYQIGFNSLGDLKGLFAVESDVDLVSLLLKYQLICFVQGYFIFDNEDALFFLQPRILLACCLVVYSLGLIVRD